MGTMLLASMLRTQILISPAWRQAVRTEVLISPALRQVADILLFSMLWTLVLLSPAFPMLGARSSPCKRILQSLMEAWALLCPELKQRVAAAEDNVDCPQRMQINPQSLFYLHHLRSCAASAMGCHGGQCWASMTMTFANEHG